MKNGFTLVELLAVVVILSILATITGISVTNSLKTSKKEISDTQKTLIISAAEMWAADHLSDFELGNCKYLMLSDLQSIGFLDEEIKDATTGKAIHNYYVLVTYKEESSDYNPKFYIELSLTQPDPDSCSKYPGY